jgi:hypothetical protein
MSDTQPKAFAPLPVGGEVLAIVPQNFDELGRIAGTILGSGLAPLSLAPPPREDENAERVAIRNKAAIGSVLMAGMELGVPPMAALRMFGNINGKVMLYGDGNVAVVRKARMPNGEKLAVYIHAGFEAVRGPTGEMTDESYGWCEAKRADNGETHREEFSIADAKIAGLWSPADRVKRYKKGGDSYEAANDSPWHRFWKRMLQWRATGYCMRWLFADVLGGMLDEFEARDIEMLVDVTPPRQIDSTVPPPPPQDEPENDEPQPSSLPVVDMAEDHQTAAGAPSDGPPSRILTINGEPVSVEQFLETVEGDMSLAVGEDAIIQAWDEHDVESVLSDLPDDLQKAFDMRRALIDRATISHDPETGEITGDDFPPPDEDEGQGDIFPGDRPMKPLGRPLK